jgi:two-component system, NtrC family, response regulator HupR/HoxA
MPLPDQRTNRIAPRLPFYTPVVASGLSRCWTTNISVGGAGLSGLVADRTVPQQGDDLEIEIQLDPDYSRPLRLVARVAWTSRLRPDGWLGLGVQFRELTAHASTQLARFVAAHKPRVLIALGSEDEQALACDALAGLAVDCIRDPSALDAQHLRSCASIVVLSNDAKELISFLDVVRELCPDTAPSELPVPPITVCTDVDSELLLPLFSKGSLYEVLRPPLDRRMLELAVQRSCERWALQLEVKWASLRLENLAPSAHRPKSPTLNPDLPKHSGKIVRDSAAMQRVYELIRTIAVHDVPVLLTGETGTGKELAAREIHALSKRAQTPFIAQDCGALTETLLESELFGHMKGAFTGATADHPGLFQIADGGTIFLDEIQNTSPALQARLLRVVEEGEVRPVGGTKPKRVDVRLIAACNVDLKQAVKDQRFRSDFYYRLNRFPIELPALRDHGDDILPLTRYFVATICEALERPVQRIDPRMEDALRAYDWPGNIRELKNAIERCLLLTPPGDEPLRWETLPAEVRSEAPRPDEGRSLDSQVDALERRLIQSALDRHGGIIRRAAHELELNPITLSRKMRRLGLVKASDATDG